MAIDTTHVRQPGAQPLACTLTPADQKTRLEEWRALRRDALVGESRDGAAWTSLWRRSETVRARLEALIEAERECCAFLTFEVEDDDEVIRLRTLFPASAEGLMDALVG